MAKFLVKVSQFKFLGAQYLSEKCLIYCLETPKKAKKVKG